MITEKQLRGLGFIQDRQTEQYYSENWRYMFDNITQELFSHNEVNGDLDLIIKVNSYGHLERVLDSMIL